MDVVHVESIVCFVVLRRVAWCEASVGVASLAIHPLQVVLPAVLALDGASWASAQLALQQPWPTGLDEKVASQVLSVTIGLEGPSKSLHREKLATKLPAQSCRRSGIVDHQVQTVHTN